MTAANSPLRSPGGPRADARKIPGFGTCTHPGHWTTAWLVEGEIVDGKAIGRCSNHSSTGPDPVGWERVWRGRADLDHDTRVERLEAAWSELGYEVVDAGALDDGSGEIHRDERVAEVPLDPGSTIGPASVAPLPIVSAGSSSSAPNGQEDGTVDEDEVRQVAQAELGRSLQDIRRLVSEAQAEIETCREAVGELVEALEAHVAEHERGSWFKRLGAWFDEGMTYDRRPW